MSTIVLRRPARPVRTADLFAPFAAPVWSPVRFVPVGPQVALRADGEDGVLTVEAPGLDPAADLSVELTGRTLTVSGVRRSVADTGRTVSRFSRSVALPEGIAPDAVTADYSAGILRVRIAGLYPAPVVPETVRVAISSDVASAPAVEATPTEQAEQAEQAEGPTEGTTEGTTDRS